MGSENNKVAVLDVERLLHAAFLAGYTEARASYPTNESEVSARLYVTGMEFKLAEVARLASPQPDAQQGERLVETVAKAIYDATHAGLSNCYAWDDQWEDFQEARRERYYKEARAAVAVLTTPSPALDAATIERALEARPSGWSWSLGEMMGLPTQRRYRCFLSDHNTPDGKAERHVCEDRASPIEAIEAAIAIARALPNAEKRHG